MPRVLAPAVRPALPAKTIPAAMPLVLAPAARPAWTVKKKERNGTGQPSAAFLLLGFKMSAQRAAAEAQQAERSLRASLRAASQDAHPGKRARSQHIDGAAPMSPGAPAVVVGVFRRAPTGRVWLPPTTPPSKVVRQECTYTQGPVEVRYDGGLCGSVAA